MWESGCLIVDVEVRGCGCGCGSVRKLCKLRDSQLRKELRAALKIIINSRRATAYKMIAEIRTQSWEYYYKH
ncbi:unnamed protein product [Thelazia callipaeda]|uniref:DUF3795 domain-containing protein n=1 Tax=Thelazia callipaeda TaxID=103827 RepID=A0A0N5CTK5_THECL|nr:unnamed protein product [Thelazia callipaeda]